MRKLLFALLVAVPLTITVGAPVPTQYKFLSWDFNGTYADGVTPLPATGNEALKGFVIYCSVTKGDMTSPVDVTDPTARNFLLSSIPTLVGSDGDKWCATTAYNFFPDGTKAEGGASNWLLVKVAGGVVPLTSIPAVPGGPRLSF